MEQASVCTNESDRASRRLACCGPLLGGRDRPRGFGPGLVLLFDCWDVLAVLRLFFFLCFTTDFSFLLVSTVEPLSLVPTGMLTGLFSVCSGEELLETNRQTREAALSR